MDQNQVLFKQKSIHIFLSIQNNSQWRMYRTKESFKDIDPVYMEIGEKIDFFVINLNTLILLPITQ